MKQIELTKGYFAIVDDEDFEYLNQFNWYYCSGYARRVIINPINKSRTTIRMHRMISCTPTSLLTDHINGNTLDNRKCNLRSATDIQNSQNQKIRSDNTTGYKGVSWREDIKKYRVRIVINKKRKTIGNFLTKEEAAIAYNNAAIQYHGIYAKLNKIKGRE